MCYHTLPALNGALFFIAMKLIIFRKGVKNEVLYDDKDHELISKYKWFVNNGGYAVCWNGTENGKRVLIIMHRLILGVKSKEIHVDHANHNKLDNRRCNIRTCTREQNARNRTGYGTSKYLGASMFFCERKGKRYGPYYRALIQVDKKSKHLGVFKTEEAAAMAHDEAAKKYYGEFANLNFK